MKKLTVCGMKMVLPVILMGSALADATETTFESVYFCQNLASEEIRSATISETYLESDGSLVSVSLELDKMLYENVHRSAKDVEYGYREITWAAEDVSFIAVVDPMSSRRNFNGQLVYENGETAILTCYF